MKRLLDRPHHLLQVSLLCNLTCSYCTSFCGPKEPASYVDKNMSKVIDLFSHMPPAVIGVTGGEPAACAELARCIAEMRQHYWMIWTNLTLLRDWMFDDNVKLLHAAFHLETTPRDKYFTNVKTLTAAGKRIICKILVPPDQEQQALELYDDLAALDLPPVLVPIEGQPYSRRYSPEFLRKVTTSHLVSTMFNSRFFRTPIKTRMCTAGTQDSILVMSDGNLLRCAGAPMQFAETNGNVTTMVVPTIEAPVFLTKPELCITPHECWCEPNHYGLTALGNENERIEHYVLTGEWQRPSPDDLLDFLESAGWNAQMARSLMEAEIGEL